MTSDDNPYRAPQAADEDVVARRATTFRMSPAPAEQPEHQPRSLLQAWLNYRLASCILLCYGLLALEAPRVWAVLTLLLIGMGAGLFVTKIVLRVESPRWLWTLAPLFAIGIVLFLWLLFMCQGMR